MELNGCLRVTTEVCTARVHHPAASRAESRGRSLALEMVHLIELLTRTLEFEVSLSWLQEAGSCLSWALCLLQLQVGDMIT